MKFRPLNDWALIQASYSPEKTEGGIIIPDSAREKPAEGIVLAIGPGRYKLPDEQIKKRGAKKGKKNKEFVPTSVLPGQRVLYMKYLTNEIVLDGITYVLAREEHILGTFDEPVSPPASLGTRDLMTRMQKPAEGVVQGALSSKKGATKKVTTSEKKRKQKEPSSLRGGVKKTGSAGKASAASRGPADKTKAKNTAAKRGKKK